MSAIDDLNLAVTSITNSVNAAITDIGNLSAQLSGANSSNDPVIEDIAAKLTTLATNLNNAVNPPAAPAPADSGASA